MNLDVLMSDRCNLLCHYCPIRLNVGPAQFLDADTLRRGIDHYLRERGSASKNIIYLGGEPLLRFELLRDAILHVRRTAPDARQGVTTNGVLLTPKMAAFFREQQVAVTLSMDGSKASHDRHRVLYGRPGESSWRLLAERLLQYPVKAMRGNIVFTPDTVDQLAENVEFMRRAGFGEVDFNPDTRHKDRVAAWDAPALRRLERAAEQVCALFERLIEQGKSGFTVSNLTFYSEVSKDPRRWWGTFESIVLGADGNFYPCEDLSHYPYESLAAFRAGNARTGIDWERFRAFETEARAFAESRLEDGPRFHNPLNAYWAVRPSGGDALPLLRGLDRVFEAFTRPLIAFESRFGGRFGGTGVLR